MSKQTDFPARPPSSISPRIYLCDLCGREFLDYNQMRKHRLDCKREGLSRGSAGEDNDSKRDYRLPYWVCNQCGYRVGPALLSERYQLCQKWQDIMETGKKCSGELVPVEKEPIIF